MRHNDRRRHVAVSDRIASQLLQRRVRLRGLVSGIGVDEWAFLLEDSLAQERCNALSIGKPLAANAFDLSFRRDFVETDETCHPAIGNTKPIEIIEDARPGFAGEAA